MYGKGQNTSGVRFVGSDYAVPMPAHQEAPCANEPAMPDSISHAVSVLSDQLADLLGRACRIDDRLSAPPPCGPADGSKELGPDDLMTAVKRCVRMASFLGGRLDSIGSRLGV